MLDVFEWHCLLTSFQAFISVHKKVYMHVKGVPFLSKWFTKGKELDLGAEPCRTKFCRVPHPTPTQGNHSVKQLPVG